MRIDFKTFEDLRGRDYQTYATFVKSPQYEPLRLMIARGGATAEELAELVKDGTIGKAFEPVLLAMVAGMNRSKLKKLSNADKIALIGPLMEHIGAEVQKLGDVFGEMKH